MSVGDVNSNKKGTGARFNSGKPDYSLMFLNGLIISDDTGLSVSAGQYLADSVMSISAFQEHGDPLDLHEAYDSFCNYAKKQPYDGFYMDAVIRVWEYGKEKYAAWNWAKGMAWSIPIACFARHYIAMNEHGEYLDDESGYPHWAHCLCNLQMLRRYVDHYPEGNDLPHNVLDMGDEEPTVEVDDLTDAEVDDIILWFDNLMEEIFLDDINEELKQNREAANPHLFKQWWERP